MNQHQVINTFEDKKEAKAAAAEELLSTARRKKLDVHQNTSRTTVRPGGTVLTFSAQRIRARRAPNL